MRFWDASAVVPLVVEQPRSDAMRRLLSIDSGIVFWWGTPVECASAVARAVREGVFEVRDGRRVLRLLDDLWASAAEVLPSSQVRARAVRLLAVHPLRASDSLQLAAGLVWCGERPAGASFVCLDERLRNAAATEGFEVLP